MICCVSEKILRGCVQLQLDTWTSCFANDEIPQRQLAGLFVNASNTSEKNPRKVLSPRSISFLAANFWGSSEATPQKRTRGHEWHFPEKKSFWINVRVLEPYLHNLLASSLPNLKRNTII